MSRIKWDLMRPEDIEIRPATIQNGKGTLLLYQDSRNTMDALDRNFGEFGWKIEYKEVAGQIYGRLSIKDPETGEWISKEDTGEESNIAANKGLSSDILKRTAVRFGYGRELYSAPKIVIPDDGYKCTGYKVGEIEYDGNRNITHLVIVNRFGKEAFRWDKGQKQVNPQPEVKKLPTEEEIRAFVTPIYNDYKTKGDTMRAETVAAFARCYIGKLPTWKGEMDINRLYQSWMNRS